MELYIKNKKVDLTEKSIIAITFQNNNPTELKSSRANYTNRIKLPRTANNKKIFELLSIQGNTSRDAYKKLSCFIVDRLFQMKGVCAILQTTPKHYEIALYLGGVEFYELIKGKTLQDLDLTEYNHDLRPGSLFWSFSNTWNGYIYAVAQPHERVWGHDYSYPFNSHLWVLSVYERTLFYKIMEMTGYKSIGIPFDDLVISAYKGLPLPYENIIYSNNVVEQESITVNIPPRSSKNVDTEISSVCIKEGGDYVMRFKGTEGCRVQAVNNGSVSDVGFEVEVRMAYAGVDTNVFSIPDPGSTELTIDKTEIKHVHLAPLAADLKLYYRLYIYNRNTENTVAVVFHKNYKIDVDFKLRPHNVHVDVASLMPPITLIDFVRNIMFRYGLSIQVDEQNKICFFKKINEIVDNSSDSLDWSQKMQVLKKEIYKIGDYGKLNKIKYADECTCEVFELDNDLLKKESVIFQTAYKKPSTTFVEDEKLLGDFENVLIHPIYSLEYEESSPHTTWKITPKEAGAKIHSIKWKHNTISAFGGGVGDSFTGLIPILSSNGTQLEDYAVRNFRSLIKTLNRPLKIKAEFLLTPLDILSLNFFKKIYLKQYARYFIIDKIINYQSDNRLTDVELIAVYPESNGYGYGYGYGKSNNLIIGDL